MSTEIPQWEPAKKFISVAEFAKLCDLSSWKGYELIEDKVIPAVKLGSYRNHKARVLVPWREAIAEMERRFSTIRRPQF